MIALKQAVTLLLKAEPRWSKAYAGKLQAGFSIGIETT